MPKQKHLGGSRRTITCDCGKVIKGHPNQLCQIIKTHGKVCPHAPELLQNHQDAQFGAFGANGNGMRCQPYQEDTQRGDIRFSMGITDGERHELTRRTGDTDWNAETMADLKARIARASKKKKPMTGAEKRRAKKEGLKPTDCYVSREEMLETAQLGDDLIRAGYAPRYMGFWKGNLCPIIYDNPEIFEPIRVAGKALAERFTRAQIVEQLDLLNDKLHGPDAPPIQEGCHNGRDIDPTLLLHTTLFATNIYAFSLKTGICGDHDGWSCILTKAPEAVCLKEFF